MRSFDIELDRHRSLKNTLVSLLLLAMVGFIFFPTFWMVSTSVKPNADAFAMPPQWIPRAVTLENYVSQLVDRAGFVTYVSNGVFVAFTTALVTILVSVPAGYAIARLRFWGKRWLLIGILASQMFPPVIIVIALYSLYRDLSLLDTYFGLILSFTSLSLPFSIWMMAGFIETIPHEIEDAARVDGCNRSQVLGQIVLPLIMPGLVAVGLFSFLNAWNNLIFALSLTTSQAMRTIPPGFLLTYVGEFQYKWADMFAGAVIVTLPTVILFIGLQRFLIKGLTAGAVKG
ncbi:MAG: Inner membrane ABC transporter permease protein YcjP [Anaerolineae bacterium]|nr:Inner membrane ABC transporter permease protein YcjP [Anaerolineae bacterium]